MTIPGLFVAVVAVLQLGIGERVPWTRLAPAGGRFSVVMPRPEPSLKEPSHPSLGLGRGMYYDGLDAGGIFIVRYNDVADPLEEAKTTLDRIKQDVPKSNPGAETGQDIHMGRHPGWDTVDVVPGNRTFPSVVVRLRFIVASHRLFLLSTIISARNAEGRAAEIAAFFDSFRIEGEESLAEAGAPVPAKDEAAPPQWAEFRPPGGEFSVQMPGTPESIKDTLRVRGGQRDAITHEGRDPPFVFRVIQAKTPRHLAGREPKLVLDSLRDGLLASMAAKLLDDGAIAPDGLAGRQFRAKLEAGPILYARVFVAKGQVYELVVLMPEGEPDTEKVGKFLDSFKLEGPKPKSGRARPKGR